MRYVVAVLLLLFLCVGVSAEPSKIEGLAWDANTETNLAGYKVYYDVDGSGPPYNGTGLPEGASPIDVGNVTEFNFTTIDLKNYSYWFVVTAYSTEGFESDYSNEVTTKGLIPLPPGGCILRIPK
jgi:hypothetical protein